MKKKYKWENKFKIQNPVCTTGDDWFSFSVHKGFGWYSIVLLKIFLRKVKYDKNQWDKGNKHF